MSEQEVIVAVVTRRCAHEAVERIKHKTLGEFYTKIDPAKFRKMKPDDKVEVFREEDNNTVRVFLRSYFE